ncbi:MAG: hypothetical protein FJY66_02680 [Calditrichaeota bacterium]|nr:hypothetical protein [Calditrichota bacterium]
MLHRHQRLAFEGSIHFVTTVTNQRGRWFTDEEQCRELLSIFESYRSKFGVHCLGYVLMPDHFHALLYQESSDLVIPPLMESFKRLSARRCQPPCWDGGALWRRRYDDVPIPGPKAAHTRLGYMHANPVRAGLVKEPEDYSWSSAREYAGLPNGIVTVSTSFVPGG